MHNRTIEAASVICGTNSKNNQVVVVLKDEQGRLSVPRTLLNERETSLEASQRLVQDCTSIHPGWLYHQLATPWEKDDSIVIPYLVLAPVEYLKTLNGYVIKDLFQVADSLEDKDDVAKVINQIWGHR